MIALPGLWQSILGIALVIAVYFAKGWLTKLYQAYQDAKNKQAVIEQDKASEEFNHELNHEFDDQNKLP